MYEYTHNTYIPTHILTEQTRHTIEHKTLKAVPILKRYSVSGCTSSSLYVMEINVISNTDIIIIICNYFSNNQYIASQFTLDLNSEIVIICT